MSQQEVTAYYDNLAKAYDKDRFANTYGTYIDKQERRFLAKYLKPRNGTVLDLGCGTGRFMDFATHGSDISSEMIKVAQEKHPDKEFLQSDANSLPFENQQFDTVYSFHVFMHLPREKCYDIIEECYRILKPGGKLIFDFPVAKRRRSVNYRAENWHAATSFDKSEIRTALDEKWKVGKRVGILFFPIHRLPSTIRSSFTWLDNLLCRSPLAAYASYNILVLTKKNAS